MSSETAPSQRRVASAAEAVKIGIIGSGNISGAYLRACRRFEVLEVAAISDLDVARAEAKAAEFQVPKVLTVEALLADPEIAVVVNLTVPSAHASVSRAALEAGKSVYSEKPLAIRRDEGAALLALAERQGQRLGCAPDTFLGGGLQTCRQLIDQGMIGQPLAATAFMMSRGPESWHPDPAFFYAPGAGPLFDMGPYYLTALVHLLGPIRRVTGSAVISLDERRITSAPLAGSVIRPETPTHVTGLLDFESGVVATLITSFDVVASELPRLEIYGSEGSLSVPDPNTFGGPVRLRRAGDDAWRELPLAFGYTDNSRGIGVADMAQATRSQRPHRASGVLAYHVLEAMQAILEAAAEERFIALASRAERPAPLLADLPEGILD